MEMSEGSERAGHMQFLDNGPKTEGIGRHTECGKNAEKSADLKKAHDKKLIVDITAMIRSVQRVEGNPDCFKKSRGTCKELHCEWRAYCMKDSETPE